LYLTGLHLEQYRHATYDPRDYYLEALRRDPKDSRCNNAMGLWLLRRGQFAKAETYFRKAIETLLQRNPNPIDGEPSFNLGLSLIYQGRDEEAFDAFYKSVWNAAWMDSGYFQLARIAAKKQNWDEALDLIDRSLIRNWHNAKSRHLKVCILRKLGKTAVAGKLIEESLALDKFNFGVLFERYFLKPDRFSKPVGFNIHTSIEFSLDFAFAGLFDEAIELLSSGIDEQKDQLVYPMALYYKAWFEAQAGNVESSKKSLIEAANACPDYCFPNQVEAIVVLEWAKQQNPADSKAPYYLGNFWYNARQYDEAIANWELSAKLDDSFPTVHRNLALAYFNKQNESAKALAALEKSFALDETDSRILMELDQLYKRLNYTHENRLAKLVRYPELVVDRDDLYLERATLYNQLSQYEKAFDLIMIRKFHPWEGGEGKVTGQYVFSLTEMAKIAIQNLEFKKAIELLEKAQLYPENLGEGKLYGAQENAIFFWLGNAYSGMGENEKAIQYWEKASSGISEPVPAIFYNDQQPDTIFYQGLALVQLGRNDEAKARFKKLIDFGKAHLNDEFKLDYFAVSLPDLQIWDDDLTKRNRQNCLNLIALGELGLSKIQEQK
jgi:tetratricopeptide (TPR) repeat protein